MTPATRETALDRSRSVGEILKATANLYRRHSILFATLAVAVMAPYSLLVLAVTGYGPLRHGYENLATFWLLQLLGASLVTPLISALHMHAVVAIGEARQPRFVEVAARGIRVLPVVSAAAVMSTIGVLLGTFALIVPGILLALGWAVVAQAAAVENAGWLDALRSSRRLTATHYGHVFGLLLVTGLATAALRIGIRSLPLGSGSSAGSVAVGIAIESAIASFAALTLALLYFDLRARAMAPVRAEREQREYPYLRDLE